MRVSCAVSSFVHFIFYLSVMTYNQNQCPFSHFILKYVRAFKFDNPISDRK
jgi:hypothetical protein